MKKAFTLLELVFVIVIIGIITSIMIPDSRSTKLREAATQLVSHIRYTQHLAMVDDKFDMNDNDWFKERWSIRFSRGAHSLGEWAYTIFADTAGASTGSVDLSEIARDTQNTNIVLTGGVSGANALDINHPTFQGTRKMNLGLNYGVINITFTGDCTNQTFAFDHMGRPINGTLVNNTQSYMNDDLIQRNAANSVCDITLTDGTDNVIIRIEPETGYARIM